MLEAPSLDTAAYQHILCTALCATHNCLQAAVPVKLAFEPSVPTKPAWGKVSFVRLCLIS